jgi:hypothetical protein
VNEIQKRVAQALGQMSVRELYKLFDASSIIMDRVGNRHVDETVLRRFRMLPTNQQVGTLRKARKLAEFVWQVVGEFNLDDLTSDEVAEVEKQMVECDQVDEGSKPTEG